MNLFAERLQGALSRWANVADGRPSTTKDPQRLLEAVEDILSANAQASIEPGLCHCWLNATGRSDYLRNLANHDERVRWAEAAFRIIQLSDYSPRDMFEHRVSENPRGILFQDMFGTAATFWTYEQVAHHVQEIAAVFHSAGRGEPRVAICSDNCFEGACCDLACLFYDIIDTPLNPHFDRSVLAGIFDRLRINLAVADTEDRWMTLQDVQRKVKKPFKIFLLDPNLPAGGKEAVFLGEVCKQLSRDDIARVLAGRERRALNRVATVMFTSGSTGEPKGVSFSLYNLVSKRFARAAALPDVGKDETLLCYLPLYHTFGRYLEMLGAIFWGGTYVFAGNPSGERLFSLFPEVNPTGFISVPIRWAQLQERAAEKMGPLQDPRSRTEAFRSVVGHRLRWGLSAAGYLSPGVFHFFQGNGVELCSGFGMTEATGGVTMTPPGGYVDNTTGIPLPGVATRLGRSGELEISGHYVARYLEEKSPDEIIPYPERSVADYWMSTGDLFRIRPDGCHEIVDRIKDIYKNSKGQTVAPRRMETKFIGVPGVKRAFLVGEGRAYNMLLIVPDLDDPVLKSEAFSEDPQEYFRQLVAAANKSLAPYERAVSFKLLERDFDSDRGELSLKGTFKRRVIEAHFADQIEELYRRRFIELTHHGFRIRIPPWFFRDLSILEEDVRVDPGGLLNRRTGRILAIKENDAFSTVLIGDLEYRLQGGAIDLGVFARQPRLWVGNPSLISFCPCKDGWDVPFPEVSPQVFRPLESSKTYSLEELPQLSHIRDPVLIVINKLISIALHGDKEPALRSIEHVGEELKEADARIEEVIWRRLEALSHHPDEDLRCLAYRTLLLDEPAPDFSKAFPTFVLSGLSFLNEESIKSVAFAKAEPRRFDALRKRLFTYRTHLEWPVPRNTRVQIENVLRLLSRFAHNHPGFFGSARAELASWALHKADPALALTAEAILEDLNGKYGARLSAQTPETSSTDWDSKLVFEDGLTRPEVERIERVLVGTTFLNESIILAFDERTFELEDVAVRGIRISRMESPERDLCYRLSVNTRTGRQYGLRLVLAGEEGSESCRESIYWHASIAGYPFGSPVFTRLGSCRPDLGAYSTRYPADPTVWQHIRQCSGIHEMGTLSFEQQVGRKLFVAGLEVFFRGWDRSGRQVVPGAVSPDNVVVSETDFPESARILSVSGWSRYENGLSLVRPMLSNFYGKTLDHYPSCKLDVRWIFDACVEALGEESAGDFFTRLLEDLEREPQECPGGGGLGSALADYCREIRRKYYLPVSLRIAVEKYREWENSNPLTAREIKEQTLIDLIRTYKLHSLPEIARFHFYRNTYFSSAEASVAAAFDRLLSELRRESPKPATQLVALSDLQAALTCGEDREVFSRMVFPRLLPHGRVDMQRVGERGFEHVVVRSRITDAQGLVYTCRETMEPVEIGGLYRLFFLEHYPITTSVQSHHYVVLDSREEIIGGICFKILEDDIAELDGIVVASALKARGIEAAMIEDFCTRVAGAGVRVVKAPLASRKLCLECGFITDWRWSGFVKLLSSDGR